MGIPCPPVSCYLIEWYRSGLTAEPFDEIAVKLAERAASMSAEGSPVQLLLIIAVPNDEFAFAVFAACSAHVVTQTCQRAGIPAQRVTPADAYTTSGLLWGNT
jgi:hypothetical protein